MPPSTHEPVLVRPVSALSPRRLEWLWPGRLALGKLALLDGDPGLGKSLVALDLAARLSTGRPFPDGSPGPGPAAALVLNAEDAPEDTVRPRLEALGANTDRVFLACRPGDEDCPLLLPGHLPALEEAVARTGARLMVLDPIMAFLDRSVMATSDQSVRRLLSPLAALAERRRCAVLMVRHLTKRGGGQVLYRGGGSIGILGACRSAWLVAPDPEQPARRVLAQVKNNLAPPQPSLAYTVTTATDAPPVLTWLGPSAWTADALLGGADRGAACDGPRERACDFLTTFLAHGPRTGRDVWDAALAEGHCERTLRRAKGDLGIRVVLVAEGGRRAYYWLLPGQHAPVTEPAGGEPSVQSWLTALRAQYPPRTPLDEEDDPS